MKRVILKRIALTNFKGHKNLLIEFGDHTEIGGDNATGKSTIFDAFVWLLFGKDQFDRKDYEIIPFSEGVKADRVNPEVFASLEVDGFEMSLKRVLNQKWTRKRGTSEEVFDGCETLYYQNDVPLKASEYKARVDMIIEETIFKLITNPASFLSIPWQKQREFLFQIAGTVSDAQIAATKPEFQKLLELVNGKSFIDFKKEISARKKKLKFDLDNIQPRIDQTSRLMPQERDFKALESQLFAAEDVLKAIDLQISDKAAAIRAQYDDIQEKQDKINTLKLKQKELENAAQAEENKKVNDVNSERQKLQHELTMAGQLVDNIIAEKGVAERALIKLKGQSLELNDELDRLRSLWNIENEKEYKAVAGCLICPVFDKECGDEEAKGKHEEAQRKARNAFSVAKDNALDKISDEGQSKKREIDTLEQRINKGIALIKELDEKIISARAEFEKIKLNLGLIESAKPKTVNPLLIPEWLELDKQIENIKSAIQQAPVAETGTLHDKKHELNKQRDSLKRELSDKDLIAKYKKEIKELEQQGSDLAQQIADLEQQEFAIDAFNRVKIDELDKRINGKFSIVKFQLYDRTNEGNEFECCVPTNKAGVPIAATNTAEKINAGLDIISTLSLFYNVSAPIFCDGAESINSFYKTNSQMIFLKVTKQSKLTISII